MCWKPDWMFCGPCAIGDLPWKSEVLLQGRGHSREKKATGLEKAWPEARRASRRPVCCVSIYLLCSPPSRLKPGSCHTLWALKKPAVLTSKTSCWGSWPLRKKGEDPRSTTFPGLREQKGCSEMLSGSAEMLT